MSSLQNVVPPSPNASSLGKYADWPVSLYTGVPEISIPLYELKGRSVSVPLSVSYHASGIKVGEVASSMGLGWVLNGGGVITRSVRGLPDETPTNGYLGTPANPGIRSHYNDPGNLQTSGIVTNSSLTDSAIAVNVAIGMSDSDPDLYMFNALGKSFKFIFLGNGTIATQPSSAIKIINHTQDSTWQVTMEDGTNLVFGGRSAIENTNTTKALENGTNWPSFISAWYLKTITSPTGEVITFNYETSSITQDASYYEASYLLLNSQTTSCATASFSKGFYKHFETQGVTMLNLQSIQSDLGKVVFINDTTGRIDLKGGKVIKEMDVYSYHGSNQPIHKFTFTHSYSTAVSSNGYTDTISKQCKYRLKLNSIQEVPIDGTSPKIWTFTYNPLTLPSRQSFAQDHWGYYNGATSNTTLLPPIIGFSNTTNYTSGIRDADSVSMAAEMLVKITYPTGGFTKFNFEPNVISTTKDYQANASVNLSLSLTQNTSPYVTKTSQTFMITQPQSINLSFTATNSSNAIAGYGTNTVIDTIKLVKVSGASRTIVKQYNITEGMLTSGRYTFTQGVTLSTVAVADTFIFSISTIIPQSDLVNNGYVTIIGGFSYQASTGVHSYNQPVGGLRIKSMIDSAGVSSAPIQRNFIYQNPNVVPFDPVNSYLSTNTDNIYDCQGNCTPSPTGQTTTNPTPDPNPDPNAPGGQSTTSCYSYSVFLNDEYGNPLFGYIITTCFPVNYKTSIKIPGKSIYYAAINNDNEYDQSDLTKFSKIISQKNIKNFDAEQLAVASGGIPGILMSSFTYYTRSSSVKCNLGSIQGGTVGYGTVTTIYGSISPGLSNGANGKTVSYFSQASDLNIASSQAFPYPPTVPLDWKQGLLLNEITYDANNHPLKKVSNTYNFVNQQSITTFKAAPAFNTTTNCYNTSVLSYYINRVYYSIITQQVQKKTSVNVNYYNNAADSVLTTTQFYYDSLRVNYQPLKMQTTNSRGEVLQTISRTAVELNDINASIPLSAAATTAIDTMQNRNIIGNTIETETYNNSTLVNKTLTNYALFNGYVLPQEVKTVEGSNAIQSRILFNSYNNKGDLLEQQKTGGPLNDYIWDYASTYPIAAVTGGNRTGIAYTSFEADSTGNWSIPSTARDTLTPAITGYKSYNLALGTITKSNLSTSIIYVVSYWTRNTTAYTITGTMTGFPIQGATINGWTYFEHRVTGQSIITISGSNNIDELRLYPLGGQMTTYTYTPLVGVTSTCNTKNQITYYTYDGLMRLSSILDQNGNIIKNYCYNYAGQLAGCPITQATTLYTASVSNSTFVTPDVMDNEWKQEAPPGYTVASDNGTVINAAGNAGVNGGRFAYFSTGGSLATPITYINGNLSFTAKGSGTIEIQLIATYNTSIVARQTFTLTSNYQTFSWPLTYLYPQLECAVGVIVNGGNSSTQASVQFQKNFNLSLTQLNLSPPFTRFRADSTSLIGNSEHNWYGWNDTYNTPRKKYLQHSAYARMRFQTSARQIAIEYVRDLYDKQVINLFAIYQTQNNVAFSSTGTIIAGATAINNYTKVTAGQTYTISGFMTTSPTYVWYNSSGAPLGAPQLLSNSGTAQAPVYQIVAPANATNLGIMIQNTNDNYLVYQYGMIQQGAIGTATQYNGTIPSSWVSFTGYSPSYISGPAIFINGTLYKYYQVQGTDVAKVIQFITDTLPAGNKTVEVMMPGQGTYLPADPHIRRTGTYLRAVYFPGDASSTTVYPSNTIAAGSIVYVHDSILSGFDISSDEENNVWMMMTKRNPSYGFTGDIFSEGYSGRLLLTDVSTPTLTTAFAQKLASFGVDKYWFQLGVNDYSFMTSLPVFYAQYKSLIQQLKALRPNAKIYIQAVGPEFYEGANGETYADDGLTGTGPASNDYRDIQRAIATSLSYCEYVNFEGLFSTVITNLADGLHPTDAGNILYANGVKNNSSLLGTVIPTTALAFYRHSTRKLIQTLSGIHTITATGGKAPYIFTLVSGTLPAGLAFNSDGTITGTPTANGTFPLSVKVIDANSSTLTTADTLIVNSVPTVVVSQSAYFAIVNTASSITFAGSQGYGLYTLSLTSGAVPTGMTFNATTGVLSGTPTTLGTYTFTIKAVDHWGFTGSTTFAFQVLSTPPTDNLTLTATVNSNNHLIVTGTLATACSQNIYAYTVATYIQNSDTVSMVGNNVAIPAGSTTGTVDMGAMALVPGSFSVSLNTQSITPSTVRGVRITNTSPTNVNLTATATSPSEAFTVAATINVNGDLILTASLPSAPSTKITGTVGAAIGQGSYYHFYSGPTVAIAANALNSGGIDFGQVTNPLASGNYTVQVYIGGVTPKVVDGKFITYTQYTYFYFTK